MIAPDEQAAEPATPDVASVSPFTKPVMVAVKSGLSWPYSRVAGSAVTVRVAGVTVWPSSSVPELPSRLPSPE